MDHEIIRIDGGSNHAAEVVKHWAINTGYEGWPTYCFEPNRQFAETYADKPTTLIQQAIWITDGQIPLYISRDTSAYGSSVYVNKLTKVRGRLVRYFRQGHLTVECIDFSRWMLRNIPTGAYIILKLDIEGAEYEVLQKMLDDGSLNLINELYVEFHYNKIGMARRDHLALVGKLRESGVSLRRWR